MNQRKLLGIACLLVTFLLAGSLFAFAGVVYAFAPDTDLSNADASFWGEDAGDYSGCSVASAGDVNGDGRDDFLIGALGDDDGGHGAGQTYLILGRAAADWGMDFDLSNADASFWGEDAGDEAARSVASAGDVNGDGCDDFLIGAHGDEDGGSGAGQTYLLLGTACVATSTGTGTACFSACSGVSTGLSAVAEGSLPAAAQATKPINFPDGLFSFNITGLSNGQTVTVTITLPPSAAPTQYWKYHPSEGGWIQIPMTVVGPPNVISITLQDGGLGDDDLTANGVIVDQGGPGSPSSAVVGWETYPVSKVRVLLPWIALLAAIIVGASLLVVGRRGRGPEYD